MARLTHLERLRRAVAEARRRADVAHTAIWKTRRAFDAVDEVCADLEKGGLTPTIRSFIVAEVKRQRDAALEAENKYWTTMRDAGDLSELLGDKRKP